MFPLSSCRRSVSLVAVQEVVREVEASKEAVVVEVDSATRTPVPIPPLKPSANDVNGGMGLGAAHSAHSAVNAENGLTGGQPSTVEAPSLGKGAPTRIQHHGRSPRLVAGKEADEQGHTNPAKMTTTNRL